MTFDEVLAQVQALLQREQRVSYRGLKRRFALDDEYLEDLKEELIGAKRLATDEDGRFLVWTGGQEPTSAPSSVPSLQPPPPAEPRPAEAERRQLTVMFCDLVGSTALSTQLDPEELRTVMQAYQQACVAVISRFDGYVAKYLGDGVLVYFGYPLAHEDDAARAARAGLGIIEAMQHLPLPQLQLPFPLQVRIGIHTGVVVAGEMGSGQYREERAIVGETPNLAARIQGQAEPDTVVISAATYHLVEGLFACEDRGRPELKGVPTPPALYRVVKEEEAQSRFEVAVGTGLTPLVGREEELGLLRRRWAQAEEGAGQVVLLSGEAGIGKSRLVQTLKEQVIAEGAARIEFRCSAYHQNSAFHSIVEHLQRLLQFAPHETPQDKLAKLHQALMVYRFPQADTFPLLAALLSLPHPEGTPPLTLSPQKQKQKTQDAVVAWIVEEAEKAAVYCAWEDLHWADPSTLEVLTLLLDQVPTTRLLALLTFRPEFTPPWSPRSYLTQLTLSRLGRLQVEAMVEEVTGGKVLPAEVLHQIVAKTDGVPLFVEELTKMVLESGLLREEDGRYVGAHGGAPIPALAIPTTLQDSLMARLDRLAPVREIAQVGAVLGREFSYELIHTVFPVDEGMLQQGLRQLVEAELIYQRGLPPQATYLFKHALIQDTAYQSLLKSRRQLLHQQVAQVLEERFPEMVETQSELLAHHYTEAGFLEQAIPYWQQAGQRAVPRSANVEAITHFTKGLELLKTLPDTSERAQREIMLQLALGAPLIATKGFAALEIEKAYSRVRQLCQQIGEGRQIFPALLGLRLFYTVRGEFQTASELCERCLQLAQQVQDPALLLGAHHALGDTIYSTGELIRARTHQEQAIALYDPQQHRFLAFGQGYDLGMDALAHGAWVLWYLGYPEQALQRSKASLTRAQELSHAYSLAHAIFCTAWLHQHRREAATVQERAEAVLTLATEQGFAMELAQATVLRGWALGQQGQGEQGLAQIRQGMTAWHATGAEIVSPYFLALLAETLDTVTQSEEGLAAVMQALTIVERTGERLHEAELYRLKGKLTLQKFQVSGFKFQVPPNLQEEAEACFHKAVEIARQQQAKSWELRAVMSLSRLWQRQGKKEEARQLLAEIYGWFTEGFDTKDLQEAKALLEELT